MPLYDFVCRLGHATEERQGVNVSAIPCPLCGESSFRQAVYYEQYTITETGGVKSPSDRSRRNHAGEKLNRLFHTQRETQRETGDTKGPFKVKDWQI